MTLGQTDNDNDNVGEVEPGRAHSSGMMRMGNKTVTSEKGTSIEKLVMRCEGKRRGKGKRRGEGER